MDNRKYQGESYLFGFQGMEQEPDQDETQYHTLFRQYDAVLGRWWSGDPEQKRFPGRSPYVALGSNPVNMIDPLGNIEIAQVGDVTKGGETERRIQKIDIRNDRKYLTKLVNNLDKILKDNPRAMKIMQKYTGASEEKILHDFSPGKGPKLFVVALMAIAGEEKYGDILIADTRSESIETNLGYGNEPAAEETELLLLETVIHEWGHTQGLKDTGIKTTYDMTNEIFGIESDYDNVSDKQDMRESLEKGMIKPIRIWEKDEKTKTQNSETNTSEDDD